MPTTDMPGLPQALAWGIGKLLSSGRGHATGFSLCWGALGQRAQEARRGCEPALASGQQGQALPLAVILLAVAALVATPVLIYISSMLLGQLRAEDNTRALLAADAGLEAVLSDMVRGADPSQLEAAYQVPSVTVNDFTPTIAIATPAAGATPTPLQQYFDPGLQHPCLATVAPQQGYLLRVFFVQPTSASYTSTLAVNWAYSPAAPSRIGVWEGETARLPGCITQFPTEQPILDTGHAGGSRNFNSIPELVISAPGVYTIAMFNTSSNPPITVTTTAFKPSGGTGDTWVYATAFKDYIITSTVGGTALKAYVRVTPGYTQPPMGDFSRSNISFITNAVTVQTMDRQ